MNTKTTGGAAVVESLVRHNVNVVFGIPGVHNLPIFDALIDTKIKVIVTRHEQGAGYMADGYARVTGKPGVCLVVGGPGLTNTCTAIGEAYLDSSPLLVISTTVPRWAVERSLGCLHKVKDQFKLVGSLVDTALKVTKASEIPSVINLAFYHLETEGKPVYVEIPFDILTEEEPFFDYSKSFYVEGYQGKNYLKSIKVVAEKIKKAEKPLFIVGSGAQDLAWEIMDLAESLAAPVMTTRSGKGIIPEDHPLALGFRLRDKDLQDYLHSRDLIMVVGTELNPAETADKMLALPSLVYINRHFNEKDPRLESGFRVCGNIQKILCMLKQNTFEQNRDGGLDQESKLLKERNRMDNLPCEIKAILTTIRGALNKEAIVVNDMTKVCYEASKVFPVYFPRSFLFPGGFGTLGFSLPAAIGARIAKPKMQVLALIGDGGFMFTSEELLTAVQHKIGFPIIVFNNNRFGVVGEFQQIKYGRSIGIELKNPDFNAMAKSYGAYAEKLEVSEFTRRGNDLINKTFERESPTLIEIPVQF